MITWITLSKITIHSKEENPIECWHSDANILVVQWGKTVEVAMHQCKELVGIYTIYEEDQSHEVYYKREIFKNILREALSSLNFSWGDVAHAALCSRVLAAGGSLAAVASASYS